MSLRCPDCQEVSTVRVVDTRTVSRGDVVRRRRVCSGCSRRWTTYECNPGDIEKVHLHKIMGAQDQRA